ncbi:MAG: 50S ribosomal protein L17 [Bdellovibrionales bacterium]|nr:50S ribosomal protein L17 [Bdellovibrionales bacterium]MCB0332345.1 50S ribosomal protein L17 [Bdellovibrionales bacterium]
MRHAKAFRKFGRTAAHRKAMFRNLATSLLKNERVETTLAKAKDLRRVSEKLITLAKVDTLHNRRQAYAYIPEKAVVHKLFAEVGPKFEKRPGGYTRVLKTARRAGDAAEMAIIELVQEEYKPKAKKKARTKKADESTKATPKKAAAETESAEKEESSAVVEAVESDAAPKEDEAK